MADKYTKADLINTSKGYAIEVEVGEGQFARIVGQSDSSLLLSANELHKRRTNCAKSSGEERES